MAETQIHLFRTLENLVDRVHDKLSLPELECLSGFTEHAAVEAQRMANLCETLGVLAENDTNTGCLESRDNVTALLYSLAHSFTVVSAMASFGNQATYHLHERALREAQEAKP